MPLTLLPSPTEPPPTPSAPAQQSCMPTWTLTMNAQERELLLAALEIGLAVAEHRGRGAVQLARKAYQPDRLAGQFDALADRIFALGRPQASGAAA